MGRSRKDIHDRIAEAEAGSSEAPEAYQLKRYKALRERPDIGYRRLNKLCSRLDRITIVGENGKYVTAFRMLEKYSSKTIAHLLMGGVKT